MRHALAAVAVAVLSAACHQADPEVAAAPMPARAGPLGAAATKTTVQPHTLALVGPTARATLQAHSRNAGGPIPNTTFTWTSRNTSVAQQVTSTRSAITVVPTGNGSGYYVVSANGQSDSSLITVTGFTPPPTGIAINPGDNFQAKVDANAAGETFVVKAGTHVNQQVNPKAGDIFVGEAGAIMDGGRTLAPSSFVASGSVWYIPGQTQQGVVVTSNCQTTFPGCQYPEQLWIDGSLQEHRIVLSDVTSSCGCWYFDYAADRIYIGVDPTGHTIQTSVTPYAFGGGNTGIAVKHLTIQHYAAARPGAVVNNGNAAGWIIDTNAVQYSAGRGISVSSNGKARGNLVQYMGQMGYKCAGSNPLLYDNEFAFNNTAGFGPGTNGEAGAGKCSSANGGIFRKNNSHDNDGPGIWFDIDNQNATIDSNTVTNNKWRGIFYEISCSGTISYNTVTGNGFAFPGTVGAFEGSGILISNSPNVEVHHNTVTDNKNGIMGREEDRGTSSVCGALNDINLYVHDNTVTQTDAGRAAGVTDGDATFDPYAAGSNIRFNLNTYHRTLGTTKWRWTGNADVSETTWRAAQDAGSTFGP